MTDNWNVRVEKVVARYARNKTITSKSNFVEDLGFDSLALMDLLCALEDEFGVFVPINLMADIRTVGDLMGATERLLNVPAEVA